MAGLLCRRYSSAADQPLASCLRSACPRCAVCVYSFVCGCVRGSGQNIMRLNLTLLLLIRRFSISKPHWQCEMRKVVKVKLRASGIWVSASSLFPISGLDRFRIFSFLFLFCCQLPVRFLPLLPSASRQQFCQG